MSDITVETEANTAQRLFELTTLYEVSRVLQASTNPEQMAFDVLTAVIGLTGARWGIIWMTTDDDGTLRPVQACGLDIRRSTSALLSSDWLRALSDRSRPFLLKDVRSSGRLSSAGDNGLPVPSWLSDHNPELILPLAASGKLGGLITLGPNFLNRTYEPFLQNLLGSVGYLVALALGRQTDFTLHQDSPYSESVEAFLQRLPVLEEIVGESQAVLDLYKHLNMVANASCTVLLEGETGTGKQLAAEVLHKMGPRSSGPFIEVDCGSVPETLIESELFGHTKGAFTGADHDRKGVFELADGGTLFLDEVSNLPLSVQGRLLHVLQERRFRPIGGAANIEVNVRVIAATNRDLHKAVHEGTFREDLFYRLYVYPVRIPPLRERREDIPILASFFLKRCADENGLSLPRLTEGFMRRLAQYDFPGNVRELSHILERVLLQSDGKQVLHAKALDGALLQQPAHPDPIGGTNTSSMVRHGLPTRESDPETYPYRPQQPRGAWVIEVLKGHRFNIKAAAETLTSLASTNHYPAPPLTDRSSLTYYLQGECFRLYLQEEGDVDRVGYALCADDDELRRVAVTRVQGYLASADDTLKACRSRSEAQERILEKFSKLPGTYRSVLLRLADYLWKARESDESVLF